MSEIKTDQQVAIVAKEIEPIQSKVANLVVKDEPSSKYATDLLSFITKAKRRLEERRKFFVGPLNDHVKSINQEFKVLTDPLEEMERSIKDKLMSYMEAERERQKKADEEKQKVLDEMAKKNGLPAVKVETEEKHQVKSAIGSAHTVKRWTWKVTDETKIPKEYWIIDEKKLNNLVKAFTKTIDGVSSCSLKIEGIEVYQEESIAIRT
jgi:hypothetical protein